VARRMARSGQPRGEDAMFLPVSALTIDSLSSTGAETQHNAVALNTQYCGLWNFNTSMYAYVNLYAKETFLMKRNNHQANVRVRRLIFLNK